MAGNPRHDLFLEIDQNLEVQELTDLRNYVSGTILSARFVQHADAYQIFKQLEKEQKLKPGDLSLLARLMRKIRRNDYAEKAEKIAEDERKGHAELREPQPSTSKNPVETSKKRPRTEFDCEEGESHVEELREPQPSTSKAKRRKHHPPVETSEKRRRTEPDSGDKESSSEESPLRDTEIPHYETDDPDEEASVREIVNRVSLLEMSKDLFLPEVVTNPDKFKKATGLFERHVKARLGTDETDSETGKPQKLEREVKLRLKKASDQREDDVHATAFVASVLGDLETYDRIIGCFEEYKATLKRITRGCLLCHLEFDDTSCYRTFLAAYRDGRLSETLTRELITDDMRAAEGEDLYVHVTLLGEDGECQDDSLSDEGLAVPSPRPATAVKVPLSLEELQKAVKKHYELQMSLLKPLIWNDDFTLPLSGIFTQLEFIPTHGKQVKEPKGHLRLGERKEINSLDDLYNPDVTGQSTPPRCVLIEGEAGGGKTTSLSKEALDAVSQKSELGRRHDLVLLIRLREVRERETIEEMVWDQCVPKTIEGVDAHSIKAMLQRNESRVLFLLDGYDELRPEARTTGQAIPKLLSGKLYPDSTIVITSRPSAGVQQHTMPDYHVNIMGFSHSHVEKYVRQYFRQVEKPELADKLLTVLSERPLLTDLIHTPFSLMIVCILFEEDPEMVSTGAISVLCENYLTCLVRKYCRREWVDMPTEGLPTEVAESLLQLGKLALEALLENATLPNLAQVEREKVNLELLLKLGVVSLEASSSNLDPLKHLHCPHKTMQEFLAGRYVAHALLNQDIVDLLQLTSITKALELSNLLLFTCGCDSRAAQAVMEKLGKLSIKEFPEQVESSNVPMDQGTQKSSKPFEMFEYLCLNILRERQEPEMLHAISKIMPIVMLNSSINSRVATALKYYIRNLRSANLPDRLILKIHGGTDSRDTVQYLQQCFTTPLPGLKLDLKLSGLFALPDKTTRLVSVLKNVPGLRLLDLSDTKLTPSSLQPLVQGFRHMSLLEELDLSGNPELRDSGMDVLQVGLHIVPHLAVLRLRKVSMTAVGLSFLAPCMYHLAGLREVDVSGNRLLDKGMEVMADIIKRAIAMKVLILGRTYISGKGILSLVKVLPHLSKLQVLDVRFNSIEDSEMVTLVQTLCQPSSLDTKQDPPGDKILTASHSNNQLRQLYIGGNSGVTGAGLGRVAQLISALPALTTLDMSGHKDTPAHLSDTAAMGLAKALHTLPVLEMLDLRYISMEPAGFQAVVRAAEEHPVLRKLFDPRCLVPERADTTASCLELY